VHEEALEGTHDRENERSVIVGVNQDHPGHVDAIALVALLARLTDSRLLLVSAFRPASGTDAQVRHAKELDGAVARLDGRLDDLEVEQLALPGTSAAGVLAELAKEAIVVA
jgi:hypothetical protein